MLKLFDRLAGMFSVDMGIDLGTANTLVCIPGRGVVLSEPSVVAVRRGSNQVLLDGMAVGDRAKEMLGKTPGNIQAIRPMRDGVIADFEICEAMLRYFIRRVQGNRRIHAQPQVVIAIPSGITQVEKQAVIHSAERAGARRVFLIEEPMAAGIGLGLPIQDPTASMVVDIGGGTTEVAVLALAGVVEAESIRVAGDEMDEAITAFMKEHYSLLIGPQAAERIKISVGSAWPLEQELQLTVKGRHADDGLPRSATVNSEEIREALRKPVDAIIAAVKRTLERTEPELSADLVDSGIVLCGGGGLLRGLDRRIQEAVKVPVSVAEDPLTAVARGTGIILDNLDLLKQILETAEDV
ncbi:MAG TPA: rod shape-determining protein [Planctomycetota bacterium]|jgi:rod shape-determining protein MreB|nr:rod shape-determining protein [Planctomycetota bacterium]